ncbi:MAG: hypothetical protein NC231_09975 [Bacillus sp. (in: Bacteria)]|nr:hypothetical protein [Bacillus sp. (in: firmicutes)]
MRRKWISVVLSIGILLSACGKNDSEKMAVHIVKEAEEYGIMPYHEFKERTGNEAEFYHGDRFIGEIPDSSLCIIYVGEYDEDIAGAVLSDDDIPIRIQGSIGDLLDGITTEMPVAELAEALSANGAAKASYELLEGGGTAYYVGNRYVQIKFDSDRNGEYDRLLLISLDKTEDEKIGMDGDAWLEILNI